MYMNSWSYRFYPKYPVFPRIIKRGIVKIFLISFFMRYVICEVFNLVYISPFINAIVPHRMDGQISMLQYVHRSVYGAVYVLSMIYVA